MCLRILALALLVTLALLLVLIPSPAHAETSQEVTVTAAGYICGAPGGFTLTYVNDYEVGITWTKGEDAVNTMIRAKYGSYPGGVDDGYLVYEGGGESTSDTAVSLDETATPVYYRAWSQNEGGVWAAEWAEGTMEGIGVTLIAFMMACAILTSLGFAFKNWLLFIVAGFAWVGFGVPLWAETVGTLKWNLAWVGILMALFCFIRMYQVMMGERTQPPSEEDEHEREVRRIVREGRRRRM